MGWCLGGGLTWVFIDVYFIIAVVTFEEGTLCYAETLISFTDVTCASIEDFTSNPSAGHSAVRRNPVMFLQIFQTPDNSPVWSSYWWCSTDLTFTKLSLTLTPIVLLLPALVFIAFQHWPCLCIKLPLTWLGLYKKIGDICYIVWFKWCLGHPWREFCFLGSGQPSETPWWQSCINTNVVGHSSARTLNKKVGGGLRICLGGLGSDLLG